MTLLSRLRNIRLPWSKSAPAALDPEYFVYIKIPDPIGPLDRGEKYEDPLEAKLQEAAIGHISGGGSQLGDERPNGSRPIEFCGLDVDVTDLEATLTLLRAELPLLKAPDNTEIQYTKNGVRLRDELHAGKWLLAQPRTNLHPGFDV